MHPSPILMPTASTDYLTDADITATVVRLLHTKRGVTPHLVAIMTQDGVVALSSCADSLLARQRTEEIARAVRGVRGVRGVMSRLVIQPANVPDEELRYDVEHALAGRIRTRYFWSAALHDQDVEVQVEDGRATHTSTVATWLDRKHHARDGYEAGTHDVNNHLRVTTAPLAGAGGTGNHRASHRRCRAMSTAPGPAPLPANGWATASPRRQPAFFRIFPLFLLVP